MKKIISAIVSATIAFSSFAALAATDDGVIYNNTFDTDTTSDVTNVGSGALPGTGAKAYDSENQCLQLTGAGGQSLYLLPESVTAENYVFEADFTYSKGTPNFGLVYDYTNDTNFSEMRYYPATGKIQKYEAVDGTASTRDAQYGRGASITAAAGETVNLKVVVYNGIAEFFVNGELAHAWKNDAYKTAGRMGFITQTSGVKFNVDNVKVTTVDGFVPLYTNAMMSGDIPVGFTGLNNLNSVFADFTFESTNWGVSKIASKNGWGRVGTYIPTKVSGNYAVDVNFSLEAPGNASRYFGVLFGINDDASAMTAAAVKLNGEMFFEQWDGTGARISGSKSKTGNYSSTIPENKKNTDTTLLDKDASAPLLSYFDASYPASGAFVTGNELTTNNRRHNLHVEVVDGVATMTFEGQTISCEIDKNDTDGYIGLFSRATSAYFYSIRVTQLPETPKTPSETTDITVVEAFEDGQELEDGSVVTGNASLLEFSVNANDYAVSKITVTPSEGEAKSVDTTVITGGTALFGIIVKGLYIPSDEMANSLFTVTVE